MTTLEAPAHAPIAATKAPRWVVMVSLVSGHGTVAMVRNVKATAEAVFCSTDTKDARFFLSRPAALDWIRSNQELLGAHGCNAYPLDLNGDPFAAEPEPIRSHPRNRRPGHLKPLTDRQAEFLEYIEHCTHGGLPPTVRELGIRFNIHSPNGCICHLKALQAKGYIERDAKLSRSIRLTY